MRKNKIEPLLNLVIRRHFESRGEKDGKSVKCQIENSSPKDVLVDLEDYISKFASALFMAIFEEKKYVYYLINSDDIGDIIRSFQEAEWQVVFDFYGGSIYISFGHWELEGCDEIIVSAKGAMIEYVESLAKRFNKTIY